MESSARARVLFAVTVTRVIVACALLAALLLPAGALGHPERPSFFPDHRKREVPEHRTSGPALVVCKPDSAKRIRQIFKGRGPKTTKAASAS